MKENIRTDVLGKLFTILKEMRANRKLVGGMVKGMVVASIHDNAPFAVIKIERGLFTVIDYFSTCEVYVNATNEKGRELYIRIDNEDGPWWESLSEEVKLIEQEWNKYLESTNDTSLKFADYNVIYETRQTELKLARALFKDKK